MAMLAFVASRTLLRILRLDEMFAAEKCNEKNEEDMENGQWLFRRQSL